MREVAKLANRSGRGAARGLLRVLMDSTKFERSSFMTIRSANASDLIITDDRLDSAVVAAFRAAGVNLQVVPGVADASDPEAD